MENLKSALGEQPRPRKTRKILLWLTVSVGFALLPLGASYINGRAGGNAPDWIDLLATGELFLIAAAIAADGIARAFLGGEQRQNLRIACGLGCAVLLAANSIYFSRIAFSIEEEKSSLANAIIDGDLSKAQSVLKRGPRLDRERIGKDSLWLFGLAVASCFGTILVEEEIKLEEI